ICSGNRTKMQAGQAYQALSSLMTGRIILRFQQVAQIPATKVSEGCTPKMAAKLYVWTFPSHISFTSSFNRTRPHLAARGLAPAARLSFGGARFLATGTKSVCKIRSRRGNETDSFEFLTGLVVQSTEVRAA